MAPEFESAAETLRQYGIPLAKVDGPSEKQLCDRLAIKGWPTLKVILNIFFLSSVYIFTDKFASININYLHILKVGYFRLKNYIFFKFYLIFKKINVFILFSNLKVDLNVEILNLHEMK